MNEYMKNAKGIFEVTTMLTFLSGTIDVVVKVATLPFAEDKLEAVAGIAKSTAITVGAGIASAYIVGSSKKEKEVQKLTQEKEAVAKALLDTIDAFNSKGYFLDEVGNVYYNLESKSEEVEEA